MPYCDPCERWFSDQDHLEQHLKNSKQHNYCFDCSEDFSSWNALSSHYANSYNHNWCNFCREDFDDEDDLEEHQEDEHAFADCCDRWFRDKTGVLSHKEQSHHYCKPCDRIFNHANGLESHLAGSTHKPKVHKCPWCPKMHVSTSAVVAHLETGTCRSGITRKMIDDYVVQQDRGNTITNPQRLLTDGSGRTLSSALPTYQATEAAWNGDAFECYFCDAEFRYLAQLNQHLASPRHSKRDQRLYRCPWPGCSVQTETLSGLVQHVERGSCGVRNARQVRTAMDNFTNGLSRMRIGA